MCVCEVEVVPSDARLTSTVPRRVLGVLPLAAHVLVAGSGRPERVTTPPQTTYKSLLNHLIAPLIVLPARSERGSVGR